MHAKRQPSQSDAGVRLLFNLEVVSFQNGTRGFNIHLKFTGVSNSSSSNVIFIFFIPSANCSPDNTPSASLSSCVMTSFGVSQIEDALMQPYFSPSPSLSLEALALARAGTSAGTGTHSIRRSCTSTTSVTSYPSRTRDHTHLPQDVICLSSVLLKPKPRTIDPLHSFNDLLPLICGFGVCQCQSFGLKQRGTGSKKKDVYQCLVLVFVAHNRR